MYLENETFRNLISYYYQDLFRNFSVLCYRAIQQPAMWHLKI